MAGSSTQRRTQALAWLAPLGIRSGMTWRSGLNHPLIARLLPASDRRSARQTFQMGAITAVQLLGGLAQLTLSARILGRKVSASWRSSLPWPRSSTGFWLRLAAKADPASRHWPNNMDTLLVAQLTGVAEVGLYRAARQIIETGHHPFSRSRMACNSSTAGSGTRAKARHCAARGCCSAWCRSPRPSLCSGCLPYSINP